MSRGRRRERGFTLIELMVALVVSSLLVGMILAIFMRMSIAYRGQRQVAEVQAKLAGARAKIEADLKLAGFGLPQGFTTVGSPAGTRLAAFQVSNSSTGADEIGVYYADPTVQAATVASSPNACTATQCDALDSTAGFAVGDLVVASTVMTEGAVDGLGQDLNTSPYAGDANIAVYDACVLRIASMGATSLVFDTSGTWGKSGNTHCAAPVKGTTVFYKFIAHAWRISHAQPSLGVLQLSPTGDLVGGNDWQDQAFNFTDMQVATRFYEPGDLTDTPDPDTDPERDWYSAGAQETKSAPVALSKTNPVPIQVSVTLVARTEYDVEGVATSSTPNLTVSGNSANNTIGDRAAVALPSSDPALSGNRVFRYLTFQVDLRNIGVGR